MINNPRNRKKQMSKKVKMVKRRTVNKWKNQQKSSHLNEVSPRKAKQQDSNQPNEFESETIEMDPLIISDEVDPELQFDETSDMESGKGSPVIPRCRTRRSQTRNIPTPKTPKSVEQDVDSEKNSIVPTTTDLIENNTDLPKTDKLDDTQDSAETDNLSTRAEAGGDITRMDFIENHNSYLTDDSYLNASRERSLSETLRSLSARRPIRPLDDYRRRAIRINQERSDLNMPFESEHIATGQKRKNRSTTPEDRKKFKSDSPSSLFSSPLATLRNKFRSDLPSSTPKLLGYRDGQSELHFNDEQNMVYNGDDEKKSWCSIM
ncbi:hypothetical protein NQ317_001819 [Molorchus minor]|uniref:Uncharacterized protein n=1 Tax=Molorchus minor TaxID=1323400 RepID=A0ABQ9J795_9CUCU|nr:hypothetical protein NQ317_001819 [Molorchus minor]